MNNKRKYSLYKPSIDEMSTINGILLGDGTVRAKGNSAHLSICTSSIEHANYIFACFNKIIWSKSNENGPNKYNTADKRTGKTYTGYRLRTKANELFSNLHKIWYPKGIKIIPQNLKINRICCMLWYLGDGGINQGGKKTKTPRTSHIKISTNSFFEKDIRDIIFPQIIQFEPKIMYNEGKPIIYVPRRRVEDFLKYIGDAPFNEYKHKWLVHPYDNSRQWEYTYDYESVIKLFNAGITIQDISKKLNIPLSCIQVYFRKNNIFYKRNNKKTIGKFNLNGNLIQTYSSAREACRNNNFNNPAAPSSVSRCCKGGRKSYKGFIWKFE